MHDLVIVGPEDGVNYVADGDQVAAVPVYSALDSRSAYFTKTIGDARSTPKYALT